MKLAEAYEALGMPNGSSEEEAKKAFKAKAKALHPDVNKSPTAEADFKRVNEAYERIKSGESDDMPQGFGGGFGFSINDIFNTIGGFGGFGKKSKSFNRQDIILHETISFQESVLGCQRDIAFKKDEKCQQCEGSGSEAIDNGCKKCGGKGVVINRRGNMISQSQCPDCRGKTNTQSCTKCSGKGYNTMDARYTINIPAGITAAKNVLNIGNVGHSCGGGMMGDAYTKVLIDVRISPLADLRIESNDVVSNISISLLEALEGCNKAVMTIDGMRDTMIVPGIRNKDEIVVPNLGVERKGNQRVIVSVDYPSDTGKLVGVLKEMQ
jgi:molecular chaperone DnaJ